MVTGTPHPEGDRIADIEEDDRIYVVRGVATINADGTTDATFWTVEIHVAINRDGIGDDATGLENVEVTARLPEATAYKHIHFGVWAGLGAAEAERQSGSC